jgi:AcrR family transcriptional regulator
VEASVDVPRRLEGDKARRIIAAMRASVSTRGAAGATFDHVAREAGVSRGLLHYYFGSKERLLVEVVRHDCEVRIQTMDERLAQAGSLDELIQALVVGLEEFIEDEPGSQAVTYEMLSASRHSEEIRGELAEVYRRWRAHLAEGLRRKEREGVITLRAEPEAVAAVLFALGDGLGIQVTSDPDWDREAAFELGIRTARRLLGADD